MAKKWHPDVNNSAEAKEKFSSINEAYQILSNKEKRNMYDRFGHAGTGANFDMEDFAHINLHDIFSQMFGDGGVGNGGNGSSRNPFFNNFGFGNMSQADAPRDVVEELLSPQRGNDIETECYLTFMEAIYGCRRELTLNRYDECSECESSGIECEFGNSKEDMIFNCPYCDGTGEIIHKSGFMIMQQTCYSCNGTGKTYNACTVCNGLGLIENECEIEVNIPQGVDNGMQVRFDGQGHAGKNGGERGDCWCIITVANDEKNRFTRSGNDIHCIVNVPLHKAILGGTVSVPVLPSIASQNNNSGDTDNDDIHDEEAFVDIEIKPGMQHEHRQIMKGKGVRDPRTNRLGHQHLHFNVVIPGGDDNNNALDERQKELMNEFGQIEDEKQSGK